MTTETEPDQVERDAAATAIAHAQGFHDDASDTLEPLEYDYRIYDAGAAEYLVVTDSEANRRADTYIRESLWAFNSDFLADYMPAGINAIEIDAIRGDRCEDANDAMVALVGDRMNEVIEDAIAADGRGHFLATYDSEEIEQEIDGRTWYAYRL